MLYYSSPVLRRSYYSHQTRQMSNSDLFQNVQLVADLHAYFRAWRDTQGIASMSNTFAQLLSELDAREEAAQGSEGCVVMEVELEAEQSSTQCAPQVSLPSVLPVSILRHLYATVGPFLLNYGESWRRDPRQETVSSPKALSGWHV